MIAEASHPTPDLSLPLSTGRALIEVKSKDDDRQLRRVVDSAPGTARAYSNSSIETKLRHGWHQIRNFRARSNDDFTVIWLLACKSRITALTRPNTMTLLYGVQRIDGFMANTHEFYEKDCFFFGYSFFPYRNLNAVVLQDFQEINLCLNPYSDGYQAFARTDLVRVFKEIASVIDPVEKEAAGECFLANCDHSRNDPNSIVKYLKNKYGLDKVRITQFFLVNYPVDAER